MKRPIALFDLDGTLADYNGGLKARLAEVTAPGEVPFTHGGPDDNSEPTYWRFRRRLVTGTTGFWRDLKTLDLGLDILDAAIKADYKVHILTRGPAWHPAAWAEKVEWVRRHIDPIVGYQTPVTVTSGEKGNVYGRVLVDDWPAYIETWLAHRPRGHVIMPAQSWNVGEFADHGRVLRVAPSADAHASPAVMDLFLAADPRNTGRINT